MGQLEERLRELVREVVREELAALRGLPVSGQSDGGGGGRRSIPLDRAVYSVEDVAALLGCSVKAVYARNSRLQIPGGFKVGRKLQFRGSELVPWLTKGRAPSAGGRR